MSSPLHFNPNFNPSRNLPLTIESLAAMHAQPGDGESIACPFCGCGDVHIIATGVQQDNRFHMIEPGGLEVVTGVPALFRGSVIVTVYQCENQHRWAEITEFFKGQCVRRVCRIGNASRNTLKELWRD